MLRQENSPSSQALGAIKYIDIFLFEKYSFIFSFWYDLITTKFSHLRCNVLLVNKRSNHVATQESCFGSVFFWHSAVCFDLL